MIYILGLIVSHVHKHKKRYESHCPTGSSPVASLVQAVEHQASRRRRMVLSRNSAIIFLTALPVAEGGDIAQTVSFPQPGEER